jgi:hypothetical protein
MNPYEDERVEAAGDGPPAGPPEAPGGSPDAPGPAASGSPEPSGGATAAASTEDPAPVTTGQSADPQGGEDGSDGNAAAADPETPPPDTPEEGISGLRLPWQIAAAVAIGLVALITLVHLGLVFLHVSPSNTLSKRYSEQIDSWVYPEFEQNWKLFAPNPLQQNIGVQVKAEVKEADGTLRTTGWIDLSADDHEGIRGNPVPSHTEQNQLRRAWDFYVNSHDDQNRASGYRGRLSESYVRRIVMLRLADHDLDGTVQRIRVRSAVTLVAAPVWSGERSDTTTSHRVLPWWPITEADLPRGADRTRDAGAKGTEAAK